MKAKLIEFVDIIFGLQWGDEGKGKISNFISEKYDMVCRWNGGPNAGHTVYLNSNKYKTHIIPCGIFKNKLSVIGPNCVLNIEKFYEEIAYLQKNGFDTDLVKVSPRANIITENHIKYDLKFLKNKLGTTGQGIAPCFSDKMLRKGVLAKRVINKKYLWNEKLYGKILCEGAQSFWLDVNYGNYPYVTSSETLPYGACSLGFSPKAIRDIIGVAKIYDTKSGVDPLFPKKLLRNKDLLKLANLGQEYGTTTNRRRIVNWLRVDKLTEAVAKSGTTKLIINKIDIIKKLNLYKLIAGKDEVVSFRSFGEMENWLNFKFKTLGLNPKFITYSGDKSII